MKIIQRWQFSSQSEQSLAAECDTALLYGFDALMVKALDGTMWMGSVDSNADALRSVGDVRRQSDYAHSRGLKYYVWVNPLQQNMGQQANTVAACINVCDGAAFDTEPYAGFLGAYPPPGLCSAYMQRVVGQIYPGKSLILQPDPRPGHLLEVRFADEWAPYATHYAPQDYVSDFYNTPTATLMAALIADTQQIAAEHNLIAWPTLPGNADVSLIPPDAIAPLDGFCVWRLGSTSAAHLAYIGGLALSTTPNDPCAGLQAQIDSRDIFIADIADRIVYDQITAEINRKSAAGNPLVPRVRVLQSIADEAAVSRTQILGPRPSGALGISPSNPAPLLKDGPSGNISEGSNPH